MAKVSEDSVAVVEELPVETAEASESEGKKTRHRENWQGGYSEIFDEVEAAKHKPVLKEDGSPALNEEGDEIFSIYKIEQKDDEDKNVLATYYTWARNGTEALVNWTDANMNLHIGKLDGKRGRQKMFKPDENLVTLLTSMKARNDAQGIAQFLTLMPAYQYVIDGTEPPATLN